MPETFEPTAGLSLPSATFPSNDPKLQVLAVARALPSLTITVRPTMPSAVKPTIILCRYSPYSNGKHSAPLSSHVPKYETWFEPRKAIPANVFRGSRELKVTTMNFLVLEEDQSPKIADTWLEAFCPGHVKMLRHTKLFFPRLALDLY